MNKILFLNGSNFGEAYTLSIGNKKYYAKTNTVSINNVKEDVVRFIKDDKNLKNWSVKYFNDLVTKLKFE